MRKRVREAEASPSTLALTPELVNQCVQLAFGCSLREQQREELIRREIAEGIRRLGKRGTDADLVIKANKVVVGTCCADIGNQSIVFFRPAPPASDMPAHITQEFEMNA